MIVDVFRSPPRVEDTDSRPTSLGHYLRIVRSHAMLVAIPVIVIPVLAVLVSLLGGAGHRASASVLIDPQGGLHDLGEVIGRDPNRTAATQVQLARLPAVVGRTLTASFDDQPIESLLTASSVAVEPDSDVLEFTVTAANRERAMLLATNYAKAFVAYRNGLDERLITQAQRRVRRYISRLPSSERRSQSPLYQRLVAHEARLRELQALSTPTAILLQPATIATPTGMTPIQSLGVGLAVAIAVGLSLAFVLESRDPGVRSPEEFERILGLDLLGCLTLEPAGPRDGYGHGDGRSRVAFDEIAANLNAHAADEAVMSLLLLRAESEPQASGLVAGLGQAIARSGRDVVVGLSATAGRQPRHGDASAKRAATGQTLYMTPGQHEGSVDISTVDTVESPVLRGRSNRAVLNLTTASLAGSEGAKGEDVTADAVVAVVRLGSRLGTVKRVRRFLTDCSAQPLGVIVIGAEPMSDGSEGARGRYDAPSGQDEHPTVMGEFA